MTLLQRFLGAIGAIGAIGGPGAPGTPGAPDTPPTAEPAPPARPINRAELYGRVDEARGLARELAGASLGFAEGARALGDRLETRARMLTQAVAAVRPTDRAELLARQALQFAVDGERALVELERVFQRIVRDTRQVADLLLVVDDPAVLGVPSVREIRGLLANTEQHLQQGTLQVRRAGAAIGAVAAALCARAR